MPMVRGFTAMAMAMPKARGFTAMAMPKAPCPELQASKVQKPRL